MSKSPRPTVKEIKRLQAEIDRRQSLVDSFEAACIERQGKIESLQRQLKEQLDVNAKVREERNKAQRTVDAEMTKKFMANDEVTDYSLADEDLLREFAIATLEGREYDADELHDKIEKVSTFNPHPQQQFVTDERGVKRFRQNAIVRRLVDEAKDGMTYIATFDASREDRAQLAQLIGYSVSGYFDLPYALPVKEDE